MRTSDLCIVAGLGVVLLAVNVERLHQRFLGWHYSRPIVQSRAGW